MTREELWNITYAQGKQDALDLRGRSAGMTGTELIAEERRIPPFDPGKDYSGWPVGAPVEDQGQVWPLLQPHNAAHYQGRPSTLRALWGLAHTTDPAKAKPWVASYGTSGMYQTNEHCTHEGRLWRSKQDNNSYPPGATGTEDYWEDLGEVIA